MAMKPERRKQFLPNCCLRGSYNETKKSHLGSAISQKMVKILSNNDNSRKPFSWYKIGKVRTLYSKKPHKRPKP